MYGLLWAPVPCETRAGPQQVTVDTIVGGAFGATVHRPAGYVGETESGLGWACRCALLRGTSNSRSQSTQSCVALGCADVGFPLPHAQGSRPLASEEAAWATGAVREQPHWAGRKASRNAWPLGRS